MTDDEIITSAVRAHLRGDTITDGQARVIAAAWHGGQASLLYSLASTGAIAEGTTAAIEHEMSGFQSNEPPTELPALLAYVQASGPRGTVEGWHELWG